MGWRVGFGVFLAREFLLLSLDATIETREHGVDPHP
jgi:hypothetical protein